MSREDITPAEALLRLVASTAEAVAQVLDMYVPGLAHRGQVVVLQVEDSGPGIPVAEREQVFQPFYRALGTNVDGSGLGSYTADVGITGGRRRDSDADCHRRASWSTRPRKSIAVVRRRRHRSGIRGARTAAIHAQMPVARNSHGSIKVEEHVHERIVIWNFNDRPVRKGLFDGALEDSPGPVAMEIINQQKPAAQAILSQASGFVGRRTPVALARLLQE